MMLAFVLGELITVLGLGVIGLLVALLVCVIITRKRKNFLVVIFLFITVGFLITDNSVKEKNILYSMKEENTNAWGRISKFSETTYGWNVYLTNVIINKTVKCNEIIVSFENRPDVKIGNRVFVKGEFKQLQSARNPGNFDAKSYYKSLGIYGKIKGKSFKITDKKTDAFRQWLYQLREKINSNLQKICEENTTGIWQISNGKAAIFSAILLGDKSELQEETKARYSMAGIAHVLAISGLHISFIGMLVYSLLRRRFKFAMSSAISVIIVVSFGLMAGMGIATMRAIAMFGLKLLGEVLGRTYDYLTAISLAGLILMLTNPFVIFNSGFQMSFGAIIAIVIISPVVENILRFKNKLVKAIIFSINVGAIMNPIIAYNYFQLPIYSSLLNIVIIPLMSVVIMSGLAGIGGAFIVPVIGRIMILSGSVTLELFQWISDMSMKLPFANVIVGRPSAVRIIIYYIIIIMVLIIANRTRNQRDREKHIKESRIEDNGVVIESKKEKIKMETKENRKYRIAFIVAVIIANGFIFIQLPKGFQVTFIDVGQGDGIFINMGNDCTILMDSGSTDIDKVGQYRVIPFLKSQGIGRIDYIVVSHGDNDHISGILEMLQLSDNSGIKIKNLVMPDVALKDKAYNSLIDTAKSHGVSVIYIWAGNKIKIGNVICKCLHPARGLATENRNDYSTVLDVSYGKFTMLLTGDISSQEEEPIKAMIRKHYAILKVAHHGSKYSTSSNFLDCIKPDYSVISSGKNNMYGHPHMETLSRLREIGSNVMRTDIYGGITIKSDGKSIKIKKTIE